jgi:hypothetical protein
VRVWSSEWLGNLRKTELVRRACEKLTPDTRLFTYENAADPILFGLAETNPCDRRGPLSLGYWARLVGLR